MHSWEIKERCQLISCMVAQLMAVTRGSVSIDTAPLLSRSLKEGTAGFALSLGFAENARRVLSPCSPSPGLDLVLTSPACVSLLSLVQRQGRALFMH